jgi:hypothetical protein
MAWRLLREALTVLTLPPEEQVRVNGPGCLACDLLDDFTHARGLVPVAALPEEGRRLLEAIDVLVRTMQPEDRECFNDDVVRRPVWQRLREMAAEALRAFGWEGTEVRPFIEVEPDVWKRQP